MNTEWKKGYEDGFAAGWKAAKNDYTNYTPVYPPVYYGQPKTTARTPVTAGGFASDTVNTVGVPTGGLSYSVNQSANHFVTGMTVEDVGC